MSKREDLLVAIDGPAGAGKSTVAKLVAERLGFLLVDTGALYRCVALAASRLGFSFEQEAEVAQVAEQLAANRAIRLEPVVKRGDSAPPSWSRPVERPTMRVFLHDEDVSMAIRTPEMSMGASRVSAIPGVRAALLDLQRQAGERGGAVLEGRDIGTVVFPDAEAKFFLTATELERARRRTVELERKGTPVPIEDTLADVRQRDRQDTTRSVAPLKQAEDAVLIDSSEQTIQQVVDAIVAEVLRRKLALEQASGEDVG